MFNIGIGELLIVFLVAFIIVGPDDLPKVAGWLGGQIRRLRALVRELKTETGLDVLEKEVQEVGKDVKATMRELDISEDIEDAVKEAKVEIEFVSQNIQKEVRKTDQDIRYEMMAMDAEVRSAVKSDGENEKTIATDK